MATPIPLVSFVAAAVIAMVFSAVVPVAEAQALAPAPTIDGNSIDQGIACALMLLALVLTYIIH